MMTRLLRPLFLTLCALAAAFLLSSCNTAPVIMRPGGFSTVVIDAGHGGKDSGERTRGISEKDVALDTAQRLRPLLQHAGLRTVMVRDDDTFVELDDRVAIANRYPNAILVSIHYNASGNSGTSGMETYFWRTDSYGLAVRVERHMVEEAGLDYHGVIRRVLRLTHNPLIPSVLCECAYLTNSGDASHVVSGEFRQQVAEGIAAGIVDQHEHGDVGLGALPRIVNRSRSRHVSQRRHGAGRASSRGNSSRSSSKRHHATSSSRKHNASSTHRKHHRAD